ncbi:hypothetical protein GUJ93_ZPchr0007g3113 [Zizania palustris]|uniref:Uncharacterized protein n=1 Tax=Zizania palustris TaxID=103762 RepID=A0A8J5TC38_ZIZPA|nr:hypothetical protein GUJ93_ZPchr0007g3113 [Zizania palustris]
MSDQSPATDGSAPRRRGARTLRLVPYRRHRTPAVQEAAGRGAYGGARSLLLCRHVHGRDARTRKKARNTQEPQVEEDGHGATGWPTHVQWLWLCLAASTFQTKPRYKARVEDELEPLL